MDQTIFIAYFAVYMLLSLILRQLLAKHISLKAESGEPILSFLAKTVCPGALSFSTVIIIAFVVSQFGVHGFDDLLPTIAIYLGLLGAGSLLYLNKQQS